MLHIAARTYLRSFLFIVCLFVCFLFLVLICFLRRVGKVYMDSVQLAQNNHLVTKSMMVQECMYNPFRDELHKLQHIDIEWLESGLACEKEIGFRFHTTANVATFNIHFSQSAGMWI